MGNKQRNKTVAMASLAESKAIIAEYVRLSRAVVAAWESGDLAGAVNELRIYTDTVSQQPKAKRQRAVVAERACKECGEDFLEDDFCTRCKKCEACCECAEEKN